MNGLRKVATMIIFNQISAATHICALFFSHLQHQVQFLFLMQDIERIQVTI